MIRTLIYGSCVSRDTFDYLPGGQYQLLTYVARQSLASAFSARQSTPPQIDLSSPFQTRMVSNDWASSLPQTLERASDDVDLVLWDLCDERLGFFDLGEGQVVTRSIELIGSAIASDLATSARLVDFGTAEHLSHFEEALGHFATALGRLQLSKRLFLLAPPWAEEDERGAGNLTSFGRGAREANQIFSRYVRSATAATGCRVIGQHIRPTASTTHKWGRAPFHYTEGVYFELANDIVSASEIFLTPD